MIRSKMRLEVGNVLGPYRIDGPLGAGGMGEVYRAFDPRLHRGVAIKVLPEQLAHDPEALSRFEREARTVAALSHPNIVAIHDFGREGDIAYVVMELLEGETLRQRMERDAVPPARIADHALGVARGLAAAHDRGIVHRDLKPENVWVGRDDWVKILDFGLARVIEPRGTREGADTRTEITRPGVTLGTTGYMAPEQIRGEPADARTDIFALGVLLFEMIAGRPAFGGGSTAETMASILRDEPAALAALPPGIPAQVERIARRCMEKDPDRRFQSARDLGFALELFAADAPPAGPKRTGAEESRRSVAVLLFRDLAGSAENAHIGLGLADSVITELALVRSLVVRPTAAILRYQERRVDPEQAGRELGVEAVVDGNFQRSGSRLRVTVQLISTSDGRPLWGTKIDTSLDDLFRMQDEVSRKIAAALEVELSPADEGRLARVARPSGEAYELYLKGRASLLHGENVHDVNEAIEWFEKAAEADPAFPQAWAGLADAYVRMAFTFDPAGDWYARAQSMCERALALDPHLPEGRYIRARLLWSPDGGFDHAAAIGEFTAAAAERPGLGEAHTWLGVVLLHLSEFEGANREFSEALRIRPDDLMAGMHLGFCRLLEGKFRDALDVSRAISRQAPSAWASYQIAHAELRLGLIDSVRQSLEQAARLFPGDVLFFPLRGLVAASAGDRDRARQQIDLVVANRQAFGHYHHAEYDVACIHALLGDTDAALDWLGRAAHNGFPCHAFFEADPLLASVCATARFSGLMAELREECNRYCRIYSESRQRSSHPS